MRTLSPAELIGEPDALGGLTGGEIVDQVNRSVVRRFSFPPQEHRFSAGDTAHDAETNKGWPVWAVDDAAGTIDLKIGNTYDGPLPAALVEGGPIGTAQLRERLRDLGDRVVREGADGGDAATALLLRRPPVGGGAAAGRRARRQPGRRSGWPSSLRRFVPAAAGAAGHREDLHRRRADPRARRAGPHGRHHRAVARGHLPADRHRVRGTRARGASRLRIGQRADRDNPFLHDSATGMTPERLERALRDGELDVAAGTAWLWARGGLAGSVDTLFVDEAGQMSLANVLAVAGAARNLVLLGDPQQLAQPSQATHPPGAGASALGHILGERATMPEGAGLLLDQTYRMHPDLCRYTSEVFYDGKLHGADGLGRQEILGAGPFSGSGLRVVEVPHEGNTNASPEEASEVARLAETLAGCSWRDRDGARTAGRP